MAGNTGRRYPLEVKIEAIRLFYEQGKSRAEISAAFDLSSGECVERWVRRYRRKGEGAFHQLIGRPRKAHDAAARIQQLEMEVALLKKYHTELRKKLLARRNIGSLSTIERNTQ